MPVWLLVNKTVIPDFVVKDPKVTNVMWACIDIFQRQFGSTTKVMYIGL